MDTICWGLLSTANINRRLIPAIWASPHGTLTGVASRDKAKAEEYARQWEIPHAFGSYEEMLNSDHIDAIYISLPNHLHAEWTIKSLKAGKHVLCEKPFALTLDEVDTMIQASQDSQRILAEAFMYRHHPQTKIAGEWIHNGRLGEIILVRGVFNFKLEEEGNVRLVSEYGGGCLWDVGVYPLSFAQFVYGSLPEVVNGFQWLGDTGIDETFIGQMTYSGGGMAQISSSFRSPFHIHAEVIGTKGRLLLTRPFTGMEEDRHMWFYPLDGNPVDIPVPEVELYSGEVEDMNNAILNGTAPYITLDETRNHVRTVIALYESAQSGKSVEV
jgi:D-xylose 1-dehydrogenase (NADP+, D-xylono-1,5-lactone-forming)